MQPHAVTSRDTHHNHTHNVTYLLPSSFYLALSLSLSLAPPLILVCCSCIAFFPGFFRFRGRAKTMVQRRQPLAMMDYNFSNHVNRKTQVDALRSKWPSASPASQLRITCVTVIPKLGEVQCNWKLQWSLAQRHEHEESAILHPPYPDQCSRPVTTLSPLAV